MTREEAKNQKILAEAMAIAKAMGVDVDAKAVEETKWRRQETEKEKQEFRNGIEVLLSREHFQHATMTKKCKNCKQIFLTTYCYHWFCCDKCATEDFKKHYGIDPRELTRTVTDWPMEPVGAVPAKMTKWLYHWAKDLVQKFEDLDQEQFDSLDTDDPVASESAVETSYGLDLTASLQFDLDYTGTPNLPTVSQSEHSDPQATHHEGPQKPFLLEDISFDL